MSEMTTVHYMGCPILPNGFYDAVRLNQHNGWKIFHHTGWWFIPDGGVRVTEVSDE